MQSSDLAPLFPVTFGNAPDTGTINYPIPTTASSSSAASMSKGFPLTTMTPLASGGTPPSGADMNGILKMLATSCQRSEAGYVTPWTLDFANQIGGYPQGALVSYGGATALFLSLADNNTATPGANATQWQPVLANCIKTYATLTTDNKILTMTLNNGASSLGPYVTVNDASGDTTTLPSTTYLTAFTSDLIKTQTNIASDNLLAYICGNYTKDVQGPYLYVFDKNANGYTVPSVIKTSAMINQALEASYGAAYSLGNSATNNSIVSASFTFTPLYDGFIILNLNAANSGSSGLQSVDYIGNGYHDLIGTGNFGHSSLWTGNFIASVDQGTQVYFLFTAISETTAPNIVVGGTCLLLPRAG